MSCRDVRDWLHREAASLDETQRLQLDDHLASCSACAGDRERMLTLHRVGSSLQAPPPSAREYSRAIARALLEGSPHAPAPRPTRWWPIALGALGAAAAIAAVIAMRGADRAAQVATPNGTASKDDASESGAASRSGLAGDGDVVRAGLLLDGTREIAIGEPIPREVSLATRDRAELRLASMRVVLGASSTIRWSPVDRTVHLERGSLELDTVLAHSVDVDRGSPDATRITQRHHDVTSREVRVASERFVVIVSDGAIFVENSRDRAVRVLRGTARIVDHEGAQLASLSAGGAWSPSTSASIDDTAHPDASKHIDASKHADASKHIDPSKHVDPTSEHADASKHIDPSKHVDPTSEHAGRRADKPLESAALLARAREQFAAKRLAEAERLAKRALATSPPPRDDAEARTILAEIAQASGNLALASERYREVAAKFRDLPAGESALYAAARIERARGNADSARALLEQYLALYPRGRFVEDVRRQLPRSP